MDPGGVGIGLVALASGLLFGFVISRYRASATLEASAAREVDLHARLAGIVRELELVKCDASQSAATVADLRESLATAIDGRARAETLSARIPELQVGIVERDARIGELARAISELNVSLAKSEEALRHEQQLGSEKLELLQQAETKLREAFKSAAADSLKSNSETFFQMARDKLDSVRREAAEDLEGKKREIDEIVEPVRKTLASLDEQTRALEKDRAEKIAGLQEQLRELGETNRRLSVETTTLVSALRQPHVRGQWGQMTLRRVMEMAGMTEHCDFDEQVTASGEEGVLRPDAVVHMSASRDVIVDAKAPLVAFLDALQATSDEERKSARQRHVSQTRTHIQQLADKSYVSGFPNAFDHVVMFVPNDAVWDEACGVDPDIVEFAIRNRVIVATPMTLLVVLSAVAQSWQHEQLARSASEISALGRRLFDRMHIYVDHVRTLGQRLRSSVEAYNGAVGSLDGRLLPILRRFPELGVVPRESEIESLVAIEAAPREPSVSALCMEPDTVVSLDIQDVSPQSDDEPTGSPPTEKA